MYSEMGRNGSFLFLFKFIVFINILFGLDAYPYWFLHPNKFEEIIIGYSYNGSIPLSNAVQRYCVMNESILKGNIYYWQEEGKHEFKDYFYYYSQGCKNTLADNLYELNSFTSSVLTGSRISIFSLDSNIVSDNDYINVSELKVPSYVIEEKYFWEDNHYYYSVGMNHSKGNINEAWINAEENAIKELALTYCVRIGNIYYKYSDKSFENNITEEVTIQQLFHKFKNIEVVQRFPVNKEHLFYVLIRINKNDIKSVFEDD